MKKSLVLILVLSLVLSSISFSFAETASVSKVVFRSMSGSKYGVSLKSVRFYDNNNLIQSGNLIKNEFLIAETDVFIVTPSTTYSNGNNYVPFNAFDTSNEGTQTWISGMNNLGKQTLTVDFKTNTNMDKIEFLTRGHSNRNHDITGIFYVDIYDSLGNIRTYEINSETASNEIITINLESAISNLSLDIESTDYEVTTTEEFAVDVKLLGATSIFAEDITVSYDNTMFELVSSTVSDAAAHEIYYTDISTSGSARYIVASTDANYGITGEAKFLTLTFKSLGIEGDGDIVVTSGLVADNTGKELVPTLLGKTYTVIKEYVDVNGDERFTLGDLAIASYLINEPSTAWGIYTPDIDNNGDVANLDLSLIVIEILK